MINAESIMIELENIVYQDLVSTYCERIASNCSRALLDCLWLNFRKVCLYIPTSDRLAIHARNVEMWKKFNGNNYTDLAIKYRISVQQVYSIIKIMRAEFSYHENNQYKNRPLLLLVINEYLTDDFIRCGLSTEQAKVTAQRVADHLCENYPGVSIRITDTLKASRQASIL